MKCRAVMVPSRLKDFFILCWTVLLISSPLRAQVVTGIPPFSSVTPSTFDTVDNGNLNVVFCIPVVTKAGQGMTFQYCLAYNNSVWNKYNSVGNLVWTPTGGWGWGGASSGSTGFCVVFRAAGVVLRCW